MKLFKNTCLEKQKSSDRIKCISGTQPEKTADQLVPYLDIEPLKIVKMGVVPSDHLTY